MRPLICSLLGLTLVACDPSADPAAEGAWVVSEDGAFSLFFPPGSLPESTDVSIQRLAEEEWEVGVPGRFERVGAVYRVLPRGSLLADAYAVMELDSTPPVLRAASGESVIALHYVFDGDKVLPAPSTRTIHYADGRVALVGTLYELGDHWFGERAPGPERSLVQLSARIEAEAGSVPEGSHWRWSSGALYGDLPLDVLRTNVSVAAVHPGDGSVIPFAEGGQTRTWDASWDLDLGLHPFALFGGREGTWTEAVTVARDPTPFTLDDAAPRDPVADPLPGWRCEGTSDQPATLFAGVDVVTGASTGTMSMGLLVEIGSASCP